MMSHRQRSHLTTWESRKRKEREAFSSYNWSASAQAQAQATANRTTSKSRNPDPTTTSKHRNPNPTSTPKARNPNPATTAEAGNPNSVFSNPLLAGYMAYEFLTMGTLMGEKFDPKMKEAEAGPSVEKGNKTYSEVARILKSDGAHISGIVNPTQLSRWIQM